MNDPECIDFLKTKGLDVKGLYDTNLYRLPQQEDSFLEFTVRGEFIQRYGFAILTSAVIEAMRDYAPLLELGAGSGYWSWELQRAGIDIIPTDPVIDKFGWFSTEDEKYGRWTEHYIEIENLNSMDAVRKYPNRNLLVVWPSYGESWAADALDIFTGQVVVYAGEWGDACAESRFFDLLDQRFSDQVTIPMPHFWGLHDRCLHICKKPKQQLTTGDKSV